MFLYFLLSITLSVGSIRRVRAALAEKVARADIFLGKAAVA